MSALIAFGVSKQQADFHSLIRFFDKVELAGPDECWNWMAGKNNKGYGAFYGGSWGHMSAHVFAYRVFVGNVPRGQEVDHKCNNPSCVNPKHLRTMTHQKNLLRSETQFCAIQARQTHCKRGHEFTPENTKRPENNRVCRTCRNNYQRRRYHEKRKESAK